MTMTPDEREQLHLAASNISRVAWETHNPVEARALKALALIVGEVADSVLTAGAFAQPLEKILYGPPRPGLTLEWKEA